MSPEQPDADSAVSTARRLLTLLKLAVTTLVALVSLAKTFGWV